MEDLKVGMALEGVITNVTAFGAFVDVGVHQDGLVHVSQLADKFVKDPHEVARVGDRVKVRVLEVDLARKRIALTAKTGGVLPPGTSAPSRPSDDRLYRKPGTSERGAGASRGVAGPHSNKSGNSGKAPGDAFSNTPFANLLKK